TPASATNPHSPLARAAQASGKKEDWWKEGGVTREKINAMCWMKYETGRKDIAIDKRAALVNACVVQTLKEHPVRSPGDFPQRRAVVESARGPDSTSGETVMAKGQQ